MTEKNVMSTKCEDVSGIEPFAKRCLVAIVMVTYNNVDLLRRQIDSYAEFSNKTRVRLVVIDNNSTDGTRDVLKNCGSDLTSVLLEENKGFASATNLGVRLVDAEWYLLLNSDAFVSESEIIEIIEYLGKHTNILVATPQLTFLDGSFQRCSGFFPGFMSVLFDIFFINAIVEVLKKIVWSCKWLKFFVYPVDYTDGACLFISKKVFERVGYLSEDFFFFFEDVEFCRRLRNYGWTPYVLPMFSVPHIRSASFSKERFARALVIRQSSELVYFRKEHTYTYYKYYCILRSLSYLVRTLLFWKGGRQQYECRKSYIYYKRMFWKMR